MSQCIIIYQTLSHKVFVDILLIQCLNKKVLLHDRKRHTARAVYGPWRVLTGLGGGALPALVLYSGYLCPGLVWVEGVPPEETWDRTLDWTSDRTRGTLPQGKDQGPVSRVPPVDRQTPVKTLPSRHTTLNHNKRIVLSTWEPE